MKKLTLILILGMFLTLQVKSQSTAVLAKNEKANKTEQVKSPEISWENQNFNFETIMQGKPVEKTFEFTNIGNAPLLINHVQSPCGCTVADYTKEAVAPGKSGFVKLTYNAASKGQFSKNISVLTNTNEGTHILNIRGVVE